MGMNRGRQRPAEAACAVGERVKRARTVLPLFALVLFGSAAPAAAQDLQGFGAVVQAAIVSVSVVVGVVMTLLAFWWKFDAEIDQTNGKIDANARETTRGLDRTNEKIDAAKEGAQGRRAEGACGDRNEHPRVGKAAQREHRQGPRRRARVGKAAQRQHRQGARDGSAPGGTDHPRPGFRFHRPGSAMRTTAGFAFRHTAAGRRHPAELDRKTVRGGSASASGPARAGRRCASAGQNGQGRR